MEELFNALKSEKLEERHAAVSLMAERARENPEAAKQIVSALKEADMSGRFRIFPGTLGHQRDCRVAFIQLLGFQCIE